MTLAVAPAVLVSKPKVVLVLIGFGKLSTRVNVSDSTDSGSMSSETTKTELSTSNELNKLVVLSVPYPFSDVFDVLSDELFLMRL